MGNAFLITAVVFSIAQVQAAVSRALVSRFPKPANRMGNPAASGHAGRGDSFEANELEFLQLRSHTFGFTQRYASMEGFWQRCFTRKDPAIRGRLCL